MNWCAVLLLAGMVQTWGWNLGSWPEKASAQEAAFDVPAVHIVDKRMFYCGYDGASHCDDGKYLSRPGGPLTNGMCSFGWEERKIWENCGLEKWTCKDKRRVLLTAENGEKHCILLSGTQGEKP